MKIGSRTGILFNNVMSDFSLPDRPNVWMLPPAKSNFISPGRRPASSMSPTLLTDPGGDVMGVIGASGGTMIPTGVLWVGSCRFRQC